MSSKTKLQKALEKFDSVISEKASACVNSLYDNTDNFWPTFQNFKSNILYIVHKSFDIDYYTIMHNPKAITPQTLKNIIEFLDLIDPEDIDRFSKNNLEDIIISNKEISTLLKEIKEVNQKIIVALDKKTNKFAFIDIDNSLILVDSHKATEFPVIGGNIEKSIDFYLKSLSDDFPNADWACFHKTKTLTCNTTTYPFF